MKIVNKLKIALVLVLAIVFTAYTGSSIAYAKSKKSNIKLNLTELTIEEKVICYDVQLLKDDKPIKSDMKWRSSDKSVATVNNYGRITGKSAGEATITATYQKKKYKCNVTVIPEQVGSITGGVTYIDTNNENKVNPCTVDLLLIPKDKEQPIYELKELKNILIENEDPKTFYKQSSFYYEGNNNISTYGFNKVRNGEYLLVMIAEYIDSDDAIYNMINDDDLVKYFGNENTKTLSQIIGNKKYVKFDVEITTGCKLVYDYNFE